MPCWHECQLSLQLLFNRFAAPPHHCVGSDLCEPLKSRGYEWQAQVFLPFWGFTSQIQLCTPLQSAG